MLKVMLLTCRRKIEAPVEHTYVCCRPSEKRRYLGPVFWGLTYRYAFPERKRVCNRTCCAQNVEPHCIPSKLLHKNHHDSVGNADLYHIPSAYFTTMLTILPGT